MKKRKYRIKIHPASLVILCIALLFLDSRLVLSAVLALFIHEGAHVLVMRLCGMRKCSIELTPFGGMADVGTFDIVAVWKRVLISGAGVAASIGAMVCCLNFVPHTSFWENFFHANASLALINVLPAWPLDGAQIAAAAAAGFGQEERVKKFLMYLTYVLAAFFALLGLASIWMGTLNPSLLVIGPYLCYAARLENVSHRVRSFALQSNKLDTGYILPAKIWAGTAETVRDCFGVLLGRAEAKQYGLFAQIDPVSGEVQRWWSENEMRRLIIDMEGIDGDKT